MADVIGFAPTAALPDARNGLLNAADEMQKEITELRQLLTVPASEVDCARISGDLAGLKYFVELTQLLANICLILEKKQELEQLSQTAGMSPLDYLAELIGDADFDPDNPPNLQ